MMDTKDAMELIKAFYVNGESIEIHDGSVWKTFYCNGRLGELLDCIARGNVLRVKREPVERWVLRSNTGHVGPCVYETREEAMQRDLEVNGHRQAVLMREVLE